MPEIAVDSLEGGLSLAMWHGRIAAATRPTSFSHQLGRKQRVLNRRPAPVGTTTGSYRWLLSTASDLDADLNLHAASVEATLAPAPITEADLREGVRGWSAGWVIHHGRHHDELLVFMTDSEPGHVYLLINGHEIPMGISPGAELRSATLPAHALNELSAAFRERLLATVLLAVEIVLSAPTILSISTAF